MMDANDERIADRVEAYRVAFKGSDHDTLARIASLYFVAVDMADNDSILAAVRPATARFSDEEGLAVVEAMDSVGRTAQILLDDGGFP